MQPIDVANIHILVLDDEEIIREILRQKLVRIGYQCTTAASALAASELLQREAFSLMLLDITMPGKSGMEFLPEVVADHRDLAVVMLTGIEDTSIAVEAMRAGAFDYITKPVDPEEFAYKIGRALQRRATELEKRQYQQQLEQLVIQRTDDLEERKQQIFALNALFQKYLNQGLSIQQAYKEARELSPFRSFSI